MMKRLLKTIALLLLFAGSAFGQNYILRANPVPGTNYGWSLGQPDYQWDSLYAKYGIFNSNLTVGGLINGQTISNAANFTGSLTTAGNLTVNGGGMTTINGDLSQLYLTGNLPGDGLIVGGGRIYDALIVGNKAVNGGNLLALDYAGVNQIKVDYQGNQTLAGNLTVNGTGTNTFNGNSNFSASSRLGTPTFASGWAGYGWQLVPDDSIWVGGKNSYG